MKFLKERKASVLTRICLTLLPLFAGGLLYNDLPDRIPVYLGRGIEPVTHTLKTSLVFFIPAILLVVLFLCFFMSVLDEKQKGEVDDFMFKFRTSLPPVFSILICFCTLGYDANGMFRVRMLIWFLGGVLLLFLAAWLTRIRDRLAEMHTKMIPVLEALGCIALFLSFVL